MMEFTATRDAIERAADARNVEKKEAQLRHAIAAYEALCTSLGIVPKLDYPTESERQEVELKLHAKVAALTNALVLTKGCMSPCIVDLNAEISHLYVRQIEIVKRLYAEHAIRIAADELVRAVDTEHDLETLTEHDHSITKLQSRTSTHIYVLLFVLYLVNAWMLTR